MYVPVLYKVTCLAVDDSFAATSAIVGHGWRPASRSLCYDQAPTLYERWCAERPRLLKETDSLFVFYSRHEENVIQIQAPGHVDYVLFVVTAPADYEPEVGYTLLGLAIGL